MIDNRHHLKYFFHIFTIYLSISGFQIRLHASVIIQYFLAKLLDLRT